MTHALREPFAHPRAALRAVSDGLADKLLGHEPITTEDEQHAADRFDRRRGLDRMSRAERSKIAYELAEGAPIITVPEHLRTRRDA